MKPSVIHVIFMLAFVLYVCPGIGLAQSTYDWFYVSGGPGTGEEPTYPAQPGQTGEPGARFWSNTWTDTAGNLWMFGGRGYSLGNHVQMSDMWKYDTSNGRWYWTGGLNIPGSVTTYPQQVGGAGAPGARYGSATWVDSSGNFWMFGGYGYATGAFTVAYLNDMWKFNPSTNIWTYEGGPQTLSDPGTYPAGHNQVGHPRSRAFAAAGTTASGDFLLFGGTVGSDYMNDLWRFSPASRTWTWIGGSELPGQNGTYPDIGNTGYPGSRSSMAFYTDNNNDLWIFGGFGKTSFGSYGRMNDLWKYQVQNGFQYMGGTVQPTLYPQDHGETGILGARNGPNFWYGGGKLWLSGGYGADNTSTLGRFNDLWSYDPMDNSWRFMDGPKGETAGEYPPALEMKGLPAGRMNGQTWTVGNRLYLYGGTADGANPMSDMWYHFTAPNSSIADWQLLADN